MKLYIYFLIMLQVFCGRLVAQSNFVVFDKTNSPFPSNSPGCIVQDKDGSYWITFTSGWFEGSYLGGGLARFDGVNWQIYTKENSPLPTDRIIAIAIDSLGRKWITTINGLVKFDGVNWTIYNTQNSPLMENSIWNVSVERDTIIWVCSWTTGFYRFDGLNWVKYNTSNSPLRSDKTNLVVIDKDGIKWFGADYSPLYNFDGTNWRIHGKYPFAPGPGGFANPDVRSLVIDKNNVKWLTGPGYWGGGIPRWYAIAKFIDTTWTIYDSIKIGFQHYSNYFGIAIDNNNIKWITDWKNGLIRYNDTTFYLFNQTNSPIRNTTAIITDKFNNKVFTAELNQQSSTGEYLVGVVFYNENGVVLTSVKESHPQPENFFLSQNYPNPFNSETKIDFSIPHPSRVKIELFNVLGQKLFDVLDEEKSPGTYSTLISGEKLPSGIYLIKMRAGDNSSTKKLTLLK